MEFGSVALYRWQPLKPTVGDKPRRYLRHFTSVSPFANRYSPVAAVSASLKAETGSASTIRQSPFANHRRFCPLYRLKPVACLRCGIEPAQSIFAVPQQNFNGCQIGLGKTKLKSKVVQGRGEGHVGLHKLGRTGQSLLGQSPFGEGNSSQHFGWHNGRAEA
ncbi:hypothetical protein [Fervidibacter sp.]